MVFLSHAVWQFGQLGYFGVSVFIIMSGILMVKSNFAKDSIIVGVKENVGFAFNKIKKLYPLHILMMFPFIILSLYNNHNVKSLMVKIISNLFLIQSYFPDSKIYNGLNGVAWYLSDYIFFCFIFPYILKILKNSRMTKKKACIYSLIIYVLQFVLLLALRKVINVSEYEWVSYVFPVFRLGDFVIGCFVGYILFIDSPKIKLNGIFDAVVLILILLTFYFSNRGSNILLFDVLSTRSIVYTIVVILLFLSVAFGQGFLNKVCKNNLLIFLGDISAYAYLIHLFVIQIAEIFINYFNINALNCIVIFTDFLVTVILSYGLNKFSHMINNKRRFKLVNKI